MFYSPTLAIRMANVASWKLGDSSASREEYRRTPGRRGQIVEPSSIALRISFHQSTAFQLFIMNERLLRV